MTALKKILESKAKIRFHDCDPFNHLNNSRYIDYFVTARGDHLIDYYGFDIYKLAAENYIGWVSAQTQISYVVPALLMETVTIQTQLIAYSPKSLLFEASMWNDDKTVLKSVMWTKLVHFNLKTQSSFQHTEELMQFFKQIVQEEPAKATFEERVATMRLQK